MKLLKIGNNNTFVLYLYSASIFTTSITIKIQINENYTK